MPKTYRATRQYRMKPEPFLSLIAKHNMSLRMFGREEEISSGYLTQLLNGDRYPSGKIRAKLMEATRLSFDELFEAVG